MSKKSDIVKKSNFFIEHKQGELGLNTTQMKILAKLSSCVSKEDKEFQGYTFRITDLLRELRIGEKNYHWFRKQTRKMMTMGAEFENEEGELIQCGILFAEYSKDRKNVTLKFHPALKRYFLNLSKYFTSYSLDQYLSIKGDTNPLMLFDLFKCYAYRGGLVISVEELRSYLALPENKYPIFGHFHDKVVKASIKAIEEVTDLRIKYSLIRENRKAVAFHFRITTAAPEQKKLFPEMDFSALKTRERIKMYQHISEAGETQEIRLNALAELEKIHSRRHTAIAGPAN